MDLFPKFIIEDGSLIIAKVSYHKDIATDEKKVKGGGWFRWSEDKTTLIFYGESNDFGKAKIEDIKACIKAGNMFSNKHKNRSLMGYKFAYDTETELIDLSVPEKKVSEFYGIAMQLSDDEFSMHCLLQEGTGNTVETSNLVSRWFPFSAMKNVITNKIDEQFYVMPEQYFRVVITEEDNKITYEFFAQEETKELNELFEKPDYFKNLDISFLNEESE